MTALEIVVLGSGSADGWPNPLCACASCTAQRATGVHRRPTAALVDGRLLLDCGPAVRATAQDLTGVEAVLVTHAHPDHWQQQLLFAWEQARSGPLPLVAPPAVCASVSGDARVAATAVRAGDRLEVAGYDVRVLAARHAGADAGPAVLYDVASADGRRLLWATDTGPLTDVGIATPEGAAYDVVALEETYGDGPAYAGDDHHGLDTFAATVAALRQRGAVTGSTRVLAVHLGHGNPPEAVLTGRLAAAGAEPARDGQRVVAGGAPGRRVLVLGGARSGKSAFAESLLADVPDVTYVASTAPATDDPEWVARVAAHRARRPAGWHTAETTEVAGVLAAAPGPVLLDSVGTWLAAILDTSDAWAGAVGTDRAEREIDALVTAWAAAGGTVVAVAEEVGLGVVPASASGRRFRDDLGRLTARLAAAADEVWQVTAGLPRRLK